MSLHHVPPERDILRVLGRTDGAMILALTRTVLFHVAREARLTGERFAAIAARVMLVLPAGGDHLAFLHGAA